MHFVVANGHSNTDLSCHRGTTYYWFVELKTLDEGGNCAHIFVFIIAVVAGNIIAARKGAAVRRKVEGVHCAFLHHLRVVHDTVVLPRVRTSSVTEDDLLWAVSGCPI